MLLPVGLSGVFLVAFVPGLWWIFTTYFWVAFPALGVLSSGVSDLGEGRPVRATEEQEAEWDVYRIAVRSRPLGGGEDVAYGC